MTSGTPPCPIPGPCEVLGLTVRLDVGVVFWCRARIVSSQRRAVVPCVIREDGPVIWPSVERIADLLPLTMFEDGPMGGLEAGLLLFEKYITPLRI